MSLTIFIIIIYFFFFSYDGDTDIDADAADYYQNCIDVLDNIYYAPIFEEVGGAYCFWDVCACVRPSVTLFDA